MHFLTINNLLEIYKLYIILETLLDWTLFLQTMQIPVLTNGAIDVLVVENVQNNFWINWHLKDLPVREIFKIGLNIIFQPFRQLIKIFPQKIRVYWFMLFFCSFCLNGNQKCKLYYTCNTCILPDWVQPVMC